MSNPPLPRSNKQRAATHLRASDARAVVQLATQATRGVARMAEGVHQSVWSTMGAPAGKSSDQTRGITGFVYQSIHGITQMIGTAADRALSRLESFLPAIDYESPQSHQREAVLAALNGVLGDHLLANNNPFATQMSLRMQGRVLDKHNFPNKSEVTGKVLVLIHGLCMNDLQWASQHSDALHDALGYTPVYLRYNTGLHTSRNGAELSQQLEMLAQLWPVKITEICVLAHSMGGLVTRSAIAHAQAMAQDQHLTWLSRLKRVVFLGTPHHGAPLERAGNWVDVILGATPYSAPFKKLGQLRSAGITDLRYGFVLESDWQGRDRFRRQPDHRTPVPLPETVTCFTIAASTASKRSPISERLIGDGLVPLQSALGQHSDPQYDLKFAKSCVFVAYNMNHLALLNSPVVTRKLLQWLGA